MGQHDSFRDRSGVALVTGGSGGIGAAICELIAARGARVALTYRSGATAAGVVATKIRAQGGEASCHKLDAADPAAAHELAAEIVELYGAVHTVIHAAGPLVPQRHISATTTETMRFHIEHEAMGCFNVVAPALPLLRETRGVIVAVTSAATQRYAVRDGLSAIPKAAVEMLIRAVAAEEGRFGVRANCVAPGMLTDGMAQTLMAIGDLDRAALDAAAGNIPLRRFGTATDIAEAVVFLASDRAAYISGQCLAVDGGFSA